MRRDDESSDSMGFRGSRCRHSTFFSDFHGDDVANMKSIMSVFAAVVSFMAEG